MQLGYSDSYYIHSRLCFNRGVLSTHFYRRLGFPPIWWQRPSCKSASNYSNYCRCIFGHPWFHTHMISWISNGVCFILFLQWWIICKLPTEYQTLHVRHMEHVIKKTQVYLGRHKHKKVNILKPQWMIQTEFREFKRERTITLRTGVKSSGNQEVFHKKGRKWNQS